MTRQKWELRYPVLLLLLFLLAPTAQFPQTRLNKICSACSTECSNRYLQQLATNGSCLMCGCLTSISFLEEFKTSHPQNVPFIYSTPSLVRVGQTAEFSCIRWCDNTNCPTPNIPANQMYLTGSSQLPDSRQQRRYVARGGSVWLSILNLTLTVDATNAFDTLNCRISGSPSVFTNIVLFPFEMTQPVLSGPQAVVTSREYHWDCKVDFVLVMTLSDRTERVDFALEIVDAGAVRSIEDGTVRSEHRQNLITGLRLSKKIVLKIPNRLADTEFSLQCAAIQREVNVISKARPIIVTVRGHKEPKDIAATLTTSGAVMASLAVIIAASFAVLYCLRKRGLYSGPYSAEGGDKGQSGNKTGGILKGDTNYDKGFTNDNEGISVVKTYSALLEEEPESSVASGSIVLDEDIQKELSDALRSDSADVKTAPALSSTSAKPTSATAKLTPKSAATAAKPATASPTAKTAPPTTPTTAAPPATKPAPPSPKPPPPK